MDIFLQQIINGLTLGSVYAIVALGYTMVYGIIQLINFAHGELVMLGAMVAFTVIGALAGTALPPVLFVIAGVVAAVPACMLVGYTMERIAYRPLRNAPRLAPLITAIGISIILQHLALLIWGRSPLAFPQIIPLVSYTIGGAIITGVQIAIIVISLLMMGIDIDRIISFTFIVGAALAAVAGVMVGTYYGIAHYGMGSLLGMKAFSAAVLGGIGNLAGAMLGGILLGIVEALGAGYIGSLTNNVFGSNYQDVFAFLVLIGVLVLRPSGLLGERV